MLLLAEDKGWAEQQVQTLLATANETVVMLNRAVPVHLTYFTTVVDAQGEVQTFADVYGIDSRMAQALFGKAAVKSDAPMFEAKAATPESEFWRSVERTGAVESISGLFGN
jgi:murein L,D-transpeptidase YcbB/YkuD